MRVQRIVFASIAALLLTIACGSPIARAQSSNGGGGPTIPRVTPTGQGGTGCASPAPFAYLPNMPSPGTICTATDAQTCVTGQPLSAGGGTTRCPVIYNGGWYPIGLTGNTLSGVVKQYFTQLPTEQDSLLYYCLDCQKTNPCRSGGSGAFAFGQRGAWSCTAPSPLEQNLNANGFEINNLAGPGASGDALSEGAAIGSHVPAPVAATNLTAAGAISITGGGTAAQNIVNKVGVNGVINVADRYWGTLSGGLTTSATGSITAGSNVLTITGGTNDYTAGMGIMVNGAGTAASLTTPSAPTLLENSAPGSTSYSYQVFLINQWGQYTAASTALSVTTGPATLSKADYLIIYWPSDANAEAYGICRGGSVIAVVPRSSDHGLIGSTRLNLANEVVTFRDTGWGTINSGFLNVPTTCPATGSAAGMLSATITSVSGSTIDLSANAATTVTNAAVYHDDSAVVRAAIGSVPVATGAKVYIPGGTYQWQTPIYVGSAGTNNTNWHVYGPRTALLNAGPGLGGLPFFQFTDVHDSRISGVTMSGISGGALPLAGVLSEENNPASGPGIGRDQFDHLSVANTFYGGGTTNAPTYDQNNEEMKFDHDYFASIRQAAIYIGHGNSEQNTIENDTLIGAQSAIEVHGGTYWAADDAIGGDFTAVDYEPGTLYHTSKITKPGGESVQQAVFTAVNAQVSGAVTGGLSLVFEGGDIGGDLGAANYVQNNSATIGVVFRDGNFDDGGTSEVWYSAGPILVDSSTAFGMVSLSYGYTASLVGQLGNGACPAITSLSGAIEFSSKLRSGNGTNCFALNNNWGAPGTQHVSPVAIETTTQYPTLIYGSGAACGSYLELGDNASGHINTLDIGNSCSGGNIKADEPVVLGSAIYGNGTPSISGGGTLAAGSNQFAGHITGVAASSNVLTPGPTCPHETVCILGDETTAGGVKVTAVTTTTCTFSATASDTVDYIASCY